MEANTRLRPSRVERDQRQNFALHFHFHQGSKISEVSFPCTWKFGTYFARFDAFGNVETIKLDSFWCFMGQSSRLLCAKYQFSVAAIMRLEVMRATRYANQAV